MISYAGGPFFSAAFPNNLTHYHYNVVDVSEDQVSNLSLKLAIIP